MITETFADKQKTNGSAPSDEMHVVAPHEPLSREPFVTAQFVQPLPQPTILPAPQAAVQTQPLKIALVGTAPSSRMLAPFNDPSWKIWGCSPGNMNTLPRFDAWFEVHSNLLWPEHEVYGKPYVEWLKQLKVPVYMQEFWPTPDGSIFATKDIIPNSVALPWDELSSEEEFGNDFFTSSFAWMMAFAMKLGAKEIALYGIDMASRDEYILQRPGFFFFRYLASKRGVKISAPHESDIMQSPPLYAIADSLPFGRKTLAREKELRERIAHVGAQRDQASGQCTYLQGALEDLDYFKSIWTGLATQIARLQLENARLKAQLAQFDGARRPV